MGPVPEGDTVWLHAHRLNESMAGATLVRSDLRLPKLATVDLAGFAVREVVSRGKHLLVRLRAPASEGAAEWSLRSHLRMDGTWGIFRPGQPWRRRPAHTIRVVLEIDRLTAVGFHLHDVALVPTMHEVDIVGHLGPDLLGAEPVRDPATGVASAPAFPAEVWDETEAVRRLAADPARPIGEAVIDQRCLAGLGTVWRAELLFLRGVHPWTPVAEVDLTAVVRLARRLLLANRMQWPQVTTGNPRRGQEHYVYSRAGEPCRRCGAAIRRGDQGPEAQERIVFWCPHCQPESQGSSL